jgi:hypothetical protein
MGLKETKCDRLGGDYSGGAARVICSKAQILLFGSVCQYRSSTRPADRPAEFQFAQSAMRSAWLIR